MKTTAGNPIPVGRVTLLFTDVEGSVRHWATNTEGTARSLERHDEIVRAAIEGNNGYVFGTAGDAFQGAFQDPNDAVRAAVGAQAQLHAVDWGADPELRVRMGLHHDTVTMRGDNYFGPGPNTAARVESLGHGGQILMTEAVVEHLDAVDLLFLGEYRLRDVPEPMRIHQVGTRSFQALRVVDPDLSTLPNPGSPIVGRHEEVNAVRQMLSESSLITLTGTGGCGKTRLAVEIAYQELPGRDDGCYFADLSAVSEGSEVPAALASAVRLILGSGNAMDQVVDHLADRKALLVLDNCEHLLDVCAEFAERLLARSTSTAIISTTRERLDVSGERVLSVPPLSVGGQEDHAIELFVERASAVAPGFTFDESNRPAITEICERLDGMPLAIELAAARIPVLSPQDLLHRMADRLRLLSGGRGRSRRRTLQATLDWSYDLLDEDEQTFFRRCGVFVGPFPLEAAIAICGYGDYEALDLLESLVAKSLVATERFGDETRFRLLETVRIYAGDQLTRAGDVVEARDAHLNYYRALVSTDSWQVAAEIDRSTLLRRHWPNVASSLEWATANDQWDVAADIANGFAGVWEQHVPATEGCRWIGQILDHLKPTNPVGALLERHLAVLAIQIDDHELAAGLLTKGSSEADSPWRIEALALLAFSIARKDPARSIELLDEAQSLIASESSKSEHLIGLAAVRWARSTVALYRNDVTEAKQLAQESFAPLARQSTRTVHTIICGQSFAITQLLDGEPAAALATLDASSWVDSVWDCSPVIRALALIDLDRADDAEVLVAEYANAALRGRLRRMSNDALLGFAALAIHQGDADNGWRILQSAIAPRTPATLGLAEGLADRIGHGEELRKLHRDRVTPLGELDASSALRIELSRRAAAEQRRAAVDPAGRGEDFTIVSPNQPQLVLTKEPSQKGSL